MSNKPGDAFFKKLLATSRFAAIGVGASVVSTAVPVSAWAAKVDFTPLISISETYTDNVQLDPPGFEKYDWVTDVTAGFRLSGTGARARINLDYTPSLLTFARQDQVDLRHHLSSAGEMELVEDHLFINESASIAERFGGSHRDISISNRNISGDRRQVYSFKVGPTLRNRFGSVATASLAYTFTGVFSDQPTDPLAATISDSRTHSVNLSINSGEDFQRFKWGLSGYWRKQVRDTGSTNVSDKGAGANVRYNLNRTIGLTGSVGYQDYGYVGASSPNNFNWTVGLRLTPNRRLTLSTSYGDRTGNRSWSFSGSYRPSDRIFVNASYTESFQTEQSLIGDQLPTLDNTPNLTGGLGSSFNLFDLTNTPGNTFTNAVFLQKRFSFGANYSRGRTSYRFNAYKDRRIVGGALLEEALSGGGSISHTFSRTLTGSLSGNYIRRNDPNGRQDDVYLASASLNRRLVEGASAFLSYSFTKRNSTDLLAELEENAVTLGISASF